MFFVFSKIIWIILSPLTLLSILLGSGAGLWFFKKTRALSIKILKFGIVLFLLLSFLPIGYNLQVFLERQNPSPVLEASSDYSGIIILGGCMNATLSAFYQAPIINGSCERILEGIKLHRQFPNIPFLYTGGSGNLAHQTYKGADAAKQLIETLGIETKDMIFERDSRNTYENMILSQKLLGDMPQKKWLLVTSASHMPRASRVFCQGGWDITPYPVDYKTDGSYRPFKFSSPLHNYTLLQSTSKELIGILAYGISGKLSLKACDKPLR